MASVANGCSPFCVSDRKWYHGIHWQDQKARQASFHKRRVYTCFKWACFLMRTKKNWEGCDRPICCFFKFKLASFLSDLQKHPSHITSRANLTSWPKWLIDCLSFVSRELSEGKQDVFKQVSVLESRYHRDTLGTPRGSRYRQKVASRHPSTRKAETTLCIVIMLSCVGFSPKKYSKYVVTWFFDHFLFLNLNIQLTFLIHRRFVLRYCAEFHVVDLFTEWGRIEGWLP